MERHRIVNKQRNKENWQSVVRYLSDGPKLTIPKTFEEGMKLWNERINGPKFEYNNPVNTNVSETKKWAILTKNSIHESSIAQLDPKCKVLYVASGDDDKEVQELEKKMKGYEVEILSTEKQMSLQCRVNKHQDLDSYSKGILVGTLFALSQGAKTIQVPSTKSKGKMYKLSSFHHSFLYFNGKFIFIHGDHTVADPRGRTRRAPPESPAMSGVTPLPKRLALPTWEILDRSNIQSIKDINERHKIVVKI